MDMTSKLEVVIGTYFAIAWQIQRHHGDIYRVEDYSCPMPLKCKVPFSTLDLELVLARSSFLDVNL